MASLPMFIVSTQMYLEVIVSLPLWFINFDIVEIGTFFCARVVANERLAVWLLTSSYFGTT